MMRKVLLSALAALGLSPVVAAVPAQAAAGKPSHRAMVASAQRVFVGEYVTWDRANQVVQQLRSSGYHAWIEHWGSIVYGSRTYAVFAEAP